jgi:hypothetical protein
LEGKVNQFFGEIQNKQQILIFLYILYNFIYNIEGGGGEGILQRISVEKKKTQKV